MQIKSKDDIVIMELGEFDIEKTDIEFDDDFYIDVLKIPFKYENIRNLLLFNIIDKFNVVPIIY